jgi:hypothetical protein
MAASGKRIETGTYHVCSPVFEGYKTLHQEVTEVMLHAHFVALMPRGSVRVTPQPFITSK